MYNKSLGKSKQWYQKTTWQWTCIEWQIPKS